MGLFFPTLRVEQAHFSPLTTYLTTYGDFESDHHAKAASILLTAFAIHYKKFYGNIDFNLANYLFSTIKPSFAHDIFPISFPAPEVS
jgi:hypothetical protein